MKIAIIGSGAQGTGLAGMLATEPDVESLVLADYSQQALDAARDLLDSLGERRRTRDIRFVRTDAGDVEAVRAVVRGADVTFNGAIPRFNYPIMKAAIAEKTHYVDLFAAVSAEGGVDHEETIQAQFDLNEAFVEAGVTALPSQGATPGWATLAAQRHIDRLDEVEAVLIRFYYYTDTDAFYTPVGAQIFLGEWLGAPYPVRYRNGGLEAVDLLESEETFDFLAPMGERKVYTVTSAPDVVLIPRYAGKPIGRVEQKAGSGIGRLDTKDILLKALQKVTSAQADKAEPINVIEAMAQAFVPPIQFETLFQKGAIRDEVTSVSVEVVGRAGGRRQRRLSYLSTDLQAARAALPWCSPAVHATISLPVELVLALGRGAIRRSGVLAPAEIEGVDALFQSMRDRGLTLTETVVEDDAA